MVLSRSGTIIQVMESINRIKGHTKQVKKILGVEFVKIEISFFKKNKI